VASLRADVERLRSELAASETDRATMKDRIDELNRQIAAVSSTSSTDTSLTDGQLEAACLFLLFYWLARRNVGASYSSGPRCPFVCLSVTREYLRH